MFSAVGNALDVFSGVAEQARAARFSSDLNGQRDCASIFSQLERSE
jgi:hypothetical protein